MTYDGTAISTQLGHLPNALVVALSGEIDLANAEAIRLEVVALARRHGPARVVVDLGAVTYLDSSGIELLFLLARELGALGISLAAVVPERSIPARPLSLVGLDDLCPVHRGLDAALAAGDEHRQR
jgi:anti-anti-sigma factor